MPPVDVDAEVGRRGSMPNSLNDKAGAAPAGAREEALVIFTPSGRRGRVARGTTVLDAARSLGVDIDSVCGGRGICTRCQCEVSEGDFPKHGIVSRAAHLSPDSEAETAQRNNGSLAARRRLGCSTRVLGDVLIDIPPQSQVHRQVVRKALDARDIELHPVLKLHYVEVPEPDMHEPSGDTQRLCAALEFEWGLRELEISLPVLQRMQPLLRVGKWAVTVAVRDGREVVRIWPGYRAEVYGVAVDVGSTTIAAHLCELSSGEVLASAGVMNPQIRYGEDLMSRVSYVMMHPHDGAEQLTAAVRTALDELLTELAAKAQIEPAEILELTLVGNPIMHHLVLGISPLELGGAPFALATDEAVSVSARELGLALDATARIYCLPCVAGHVGADTAAIVLSEAPQLNDEIQLLVDIGTNAEIVLGNRERLLACSSPTGPAFEGAQISAGQRAAPGAIERVRIDPITYAPRFKVIGCEPWSDDPDFNEANKGVGVSGICGSGIIEAVAELFLAGIINPEGVIEAPGKVGGCDRIVRHGRTYAYQLHRGYPDAEPHQDAVRVAEGNVEVIITQADVRAIQLAKAALHAGCQLLMDRMHIDAVDRIRLAGAFGSQIDVKYAMVLGLIPDCDLAQVSSAGNAAGTGARIALLDERARRDVERLVRTIEKVETAVEPEFQRHFVAAMSFPHRTHPYSRLAQAVRLPPRADASGESNSRPRRRRRRIAQTSERNE